MACTTVYSYTVGHCAMLQNYIKRSHLDKLNIDFTEKKLIIKILDDNVILDSIHQWTALLVKQFMLKINVLCFF